MVWRRDGRMHPVLWWALVAVVVVVAVVAGGCGSGEPLEVGREGYDPEVAERMSEHLTEMEGNDVLAEVLLEEENTTLTLRETPYLTEWEIYEVAYSGESHRSFWDVATSAEYSAPLTGFPAGFAIVLEEDPGRIADAETALAVVRDYLVMTAPGGPDTETEILDSAEDIYLSPQFEEEIQQVREEFGDVVEPPQVTEDDDVFTVVAYVQTDLELQRRTVTLTREGTMTDDTEVLSERLMEPVEPFDPEALESLDPEDFDDLDPEDLATLDPDDLD